MSGTEPTPEVTPEPEPAGPVDDFTNEVLPDNTQVPVGRPTEVK